MDAKITANKLGEYLTASARRRKTIITTLQQEGSYPAIHYIDARNAIVDYLTGNLTHKELLERSQALKTFSSENKFTTDTKNASGHAIDDFLDLADDIVVTGCVLNKANDFDSHSLTISGVKVTARPDIILTSSTTDEVIGCIKFSFSQSAKLDEEAALYTATVMKQHLEQNLANGQKIDSKKVLIIDNPTGEIYEAPKSFKSRMKDIEAACEEIYARWVS